MGKSDEARIAILKDALAEAQMTVRAYDTKAQIVGVGYIFALGVIGRLGEFLPEPGDIGAVVVILSWVIVILPIVLFGHVLYPSRRTVPEIQGEPAAGVQQLLYIVSARHGTIGSLKDGLDACDPVDEYAYEALKTSMLREVKRQRFLRALFATVFAFAFLFASQVIRGF